MHRFQVWPASMVAFLIAAAASAAADSADWAKMKGITPRGYVCYRALAAPAIDGKLDEQAWQAVPWTEDFVDIEGDSRPAPRMKTRAKMLWDDEAFYIAAELDEPHVWGTLTAHDSVIFQDNDFELFIDPDGDNHEYYEFEMNALNTTWDLFLPKPYKDGGKADNGWEIPGLKTAVSVRGTLNEPADKDEGWSVEIAIPWQALREFAHRPAPPRDGDAWRVNFSRVQWRHEVVDGKYSKVAGVREDNWVWSPQGIIDMHRPERWGYVQFSTSEPGATKFAADPALATRDLLMGVYHQQMAFHQKHQRWAKSLAELRFESADAVELEATAEGYLASAKAKRPGGEQQRWHVRHDSKLWAAPSPIEAALIRAGDNRAQIQKALDDSPVGQLEAMRFLVANMPDRDLTELSAEFLLDNVRLAYQAVDAAPWKEKLPEDIFFNQVLPYASINERRDAWRADVYKQCQPLVAEARSPSAAAAILNQKIFSLWNVRYSTQRPKADQSPYESIRAGLASCTGLSVLLIDACRSVGVPARFVGTPLWSNKSGNHSWVEIWDDGWHFTGAAEPAGDELDEAWFNERAATADRDHPLHAIFAVSFKRTPLTFPLVWDRDCDYVHAVNVTDRYTARGGKLPEGMVRVMFRVLDGPRGQRVAAAIKVSDRAGQVLFEGRTNDERFDANDHLAATLPVGQELTVELREGERALTESIVTDQRDQPWTWSLAPGPVGAADVNPSDSGSAVAALEEFLATPVESREPIDKASFARIALTRADAERAAELLWDDHAAQIRAMRAEEMKNHELLQGDLKMPFFIKTFGDKPAGGRSLYISMHGGGGAPAAVNDRQWENQKRLYELTEGVYVAPRAPTNTWDLWHQAHIDGLFQRLIENLIVFEDVNPDRVYILGYSAGGDGVYQLAPRMADQLAAAAMMAGHPNETSPLGLRNLPFTIHVGGQDAAYNRNEVAREWEKRLADLHNADRDGYVHLVKIYPDKGHWLDREDAAAIGWLADHTRAPFPKRIVWKQDDVAHSRFYWLAADVGHFDERAEVTARLDGQSIELSTKDYRRVTIRLCDQLLDLDQPLTISCQGKTLFHDRASRLIACLAKTLAERGDPRSLYCSEISVDLAGGSK